MNNVCDFANGTSLREREEVEKALLHGEEIVWAVKPVPRVWNWQSLPMMLFATFWTGFIAFWTYAAMGMPTSLADFGKISASQIPFILFSIPFWLIGLGMLSSPIWLKRKLRGSVYVITNRRALVVQPSLFSWSTEVYPLDEYMLQQRIVRRNGEGDLIFSIDHANRDVAKKGFMQLPDVAEAERQLNAALAAAGRVTG